MRQNIKMAQKMDSPLFHLDHLLVVVFFIISLQLQLSIESDTINLGSGDKLTGNNTLSSKGGVFEMGFFAPPGNSSNYYIGIWYKYKGVPMAEKTVVWVANRDNPASDPYSSWLELDEDGNLVLLTSSRSSHEVEVVWKTISMYGQSSPNSTIGTLGDDGNFVITIRSTDYQGIAWQSFDNPTDTWLPGAKFGYDYYTATETALTSWTDKTNPAMGSFFIHISKIHTNFAELQMSVRYGSDCCYASVYDVYSGDANGCGSILFSDGYIEIKYSSNNSYCLLRYVLDVTGELKLFVWWDHIKHWQLVTIINRNMNGHKHGKMNATRIAIVASPILAPLLVGVSILLIVARRKRTATSLEAPGGDTLKQYKHRDIQRATKNFTQKLGEGGFSTVYKGELPDSTSIAVKELQGLLQQEKQLRAELNTVGLIHHKNLVSLRGFCLERSKRFIIYDYMPNGSLESHLFQRGSDILDWGTRYNIALGTARGLAYLHEECRECIIHCDIKPENILLDAEFNPKVADFGLAKLLGRNFSRVLTTMRGTRGYLAPEWFSGEPVTAKVDVYSYGQVLFEIISGRRNMNILNDDLNNYFPARVLNALNIGGNVLPLVDSKLEGEVNVDELTRACKVACWCIQDHDECRPTMTQVVQILEGLIEVGIPPIPRYFQSIAEASMKESYFKESEAYSTSSTLTSSFTFHPPVSSSITNY